MLIEGKTQRDGAASVIGGVDSSRLPSLLNPSQLAFAGNIVVRGGFAASRPGFTQLPLTYPSDEIANWIETYVLQGAIIFSPNNRTEIHVASVGGRIFTADPMAGFAVREITPTKLTKTIANFTVPAVQASVTVQVNDFTYIKVGYPLMINGKTYIVTSTSGNTLTVTNIDDTAGPVIASGAIVVYLDPNSPILGRAWMIQAEIFLIIQDGQSRAIIYDGASTFRSDITLTQIPTGTVMAYGKGRIWVAINTQDFVAGDIVRGPLPNGAVSSYGDVDNILYFTENTFLSGGGAFTIPIPSGRITAMQFMPMLDTSTGNGPLVIFSERGAFTVDAPIDRQLWASVRSPLQTVVMVGSGAMAQASTVNTTNSDIFFRRADGLASFVLAYRMSQSEWGNAPLSSELDRVIKFDDANLLKYGSAIQFDNRLLFTVVPQPTAYNAYHLAFGSLDFHPISTMANKSPPVYDGIWTGIKVTYLYSGTIKGDHRGFSWVLNGDGKNELWEISKTNAFDNTDGRINSFIETRSFYGKSMTELKKLYGGEIWVDDVKGTVDFTLFYRSDQYPCWTEWGRNQSVCANFRDCPVPDPTCSTPIVYRPNYKTRLNFGQPPASPGTDDKPANVGFEFQLRLEWTGHCRIRKIVGILQVQDENPYPVVV